MSLMTLVVVVWASCTAFLTGLMVYRAAFTAHSEKTLSLMAGSTVDVIQRVRKLNRVDSVIRNLAITVGVLLLIVGAVWFRRGLYGPMILF